MHGQRRRGEWMNIGNVLSLVASFFVCVSVTCVTHFSGDIISCIKYSLNWGKSVIHHRSESKTIARLNDLEEQPVMDKVRYIAYREVHDEVITRAGDLFITC